MNSDKTRMLILQLVAIITGIVIAVWIFGAVTG